MTARPVLVTLALSLASCGRAPEPVFSEVVTLAVLTGLEGTTEPCGCTSKPLGGLDRIAARLEGVRQAGPTELVLTGSTFFTHDVPPLGQEEQEQRKAEAIAQILARLRPMAVLPGAKDAGRAGRLERHGLPIFSRPRTPNIALRADCTLRNIGGLDIGLLGVPRDASAEADSYTAGAAMLRKQGADVIVALLPEGGAAADELVAKIDGVNVAVAGGSDELAPPHMVAGTLVVEAGDRGRYLGLLRFHRPAPSAPGDAPKWVFYDTRGVASQALEARTKRLEAEIAAMPAGPAREARQKKLAELKSSAPAAPPPPPKGPYVSWSAEEIPKSVLPAKWASDILADYNRSLCAVAARATADLVCEPAARPSDQFVGNAECGSCHPEALEHWAKTKHAQAWETLQSAGKQCDLGCIDCHTIGFQRAGGFCRLADAEANADVGCESCHGPGAGHAAEPYDRAQQSAAFTRGRSPEVCTGCHTPEHSDLFDFATYLPRILGPGHGGS